MPNMPVKKVGIIMLEIVLMVGLSIDTFNYDMRCFNNAKPIFEESIKNVEYDKIPSQVQVMIKDQNGPFELNLLLLKLKIEN